MEKNIISKYDHYDIFEGMTSITSIITAIESNISHQKIEMILYNSDKKKSKYNELKFLESKAHLLGFDLKPVSHSEIDQIASGKTHGGIIAVCQKDPILPLLPSTDIIENGFYMLLDGIEDPFNFAYAIRSAYAAGVDGIIVPSYHFDNARGAICKSSAGTSELIPIYSADIIDAIDIFKSKSYKIVCAGIRNSVSLYEADLKNPILLIVGGEKRGISAAALTASDCIVRIDYGKTFRGSLTASSAATVLAFEVFRQNKERSI